MLLRTQPRQIDDGHGWSRLAVATLDGVAREIRDRLSDSLSDTPDSVLVIDDDPDMMLATRHAIEHSGFSVVTTADGLSALNALPVTPVVAVVLGHGGGHRCIV